MKRLIFVVVYFVSLLTACGERAIDSSVKVESDSPKNEQTSVVFKFFEQSIENIVVNEVGVGPDEFYNFLIQDVEYNVMRPFLASSFRNYIHTAKELMKFELKYSYTAGRYLAQTYEGMTKLMALRFPGEIPYYSRIPTDLFPIKINVDLDGEDVRFSLNEKGEVSMIQGQAVLSKNINNLILSSDKTVKTLEGYELDDTAKMKLNLANKLLNEVRDEQNLPILDRFYQAGLVLNICEEVLNSMPARK